ncbi:MAG: DUF6797 domain-containing protein [Gemmataceae bacterium]
MTRITFVALFLASSAFAQSTTAKKIVLVAGAPDAGHPKGTHEYEKTVRLLRHCLETSPNLRGITTEYHFNGWVRNDATLDTADCLVLVASGSDRNVQDHPLLVGERLSAIDRLMKRGGGLVLIHWCTFFPNAGAGEKALEWVGGHFDYQSGPPPRRWASDIQVAETTATPARLDHALSRGLKPFAVRDEFYYQIKFRPNDPRLVPVLRVKLPKVDEEQTVAWAAERADGGRGFGFTGGHFFDNWWNDDFRKMALNAIAWTAKADVPVGGVESKPLAKEILDAPEPTVDPAWTPRAVPGGAVWEKADDKDWIDDRFRRMNTGPFLNATFQYPLAKGRGLVTKGTAVKFNGAAVLFDRSRLRYAAGWTGDYLLHSDKRFGLLNTPMPAGRITLTAGRETDSYSKSMPLPPEVARYRGLYLHGDRVVFRYDVAGVEVLDSPRFDGSTFVHDVNSAIAWNAGPVPTQNADLRPLTKPGPRRWGEPLVTKGERGPDDGPYAIDTLTIPYDNPYKALFFCTGLDFFPDGTLAVCTCHGDVWLVRGIDDSLSRLTWQRYATGLYQPLGLKVVGGKVVVLERGQLTRLHDHNGDGEADEYECISNGWDTGPGEHSYDTCLEVDAAGNFYFFKGGDTELPTGGCLLRVPAAGGKAEVFATGFRHPIGMGLSPGGVLTGADQEGNWMPATRIDMYKPGGFYGDMRAHHRPVAPKIYDPPLLWLPREADNSAGGQTWSTDRRFGPLAGRMLHLSFGRCRMLEVLPQKVGETWQAGAVDLGLFCLSGICRAATNPKDGQLYVCGLNGWQTAARRDGCVQRVRYTGQPCRVPDGYTVGPKTVRLSFAQSLDKATAEDLTSYRFEMWNYRWSGEYGSKRWRVTSTTQEGQDLLPVTAAQLSSDGKAVTLTVPGLTPTMQTQLDYRLRTADGALVAGTVYGTVHTLGD